MANKTNTIQELNLADNIFIWESNERLGNMPHDTGKNIKYPH